jgi:hypothetical protein
MTPNPALPSDARQSRPVPVTPSHTRTSRHGHRAAPEPANYEPGQPFNPRHYRAHGLTPAEIILIQPGLKPSTKVVYACLVALTEPETGLCTISYPDLAEKANITRRSLFRDLGVLKAVNLLRIERNGPRVCTFRFLYLDLLDVPKVTHLLNDVPNSTHLLKRCAKFDTLSNLVQTPGDLEQGFADCSLDHTLVVEKEQVNTSTISARKLPLQNREEKEEEVGRFVGVEEPEQPTHLPSSFSGEKYGQVSAYLSEFLSFVHRPATDLEIGKVTQALGQAPVEQLAARVELRQGNGLQVTGYALFVGIAKECAKSGAAWSAATAAGRNGNGKTPLRYDKNAAAVAMMIERRIKEKNES